MDYAYKDTRVVLLVKTIAPQRYYIYIAKAFVSRAELPFAKAEFMRNNGLLVGLFSVEKFCGMCGHAVDGNLIVWKIFRGICEVHLRIIQN